MTIPSHNGYTERAVMNVPEGLETGSTGLDEYIAQATEELTTISELANRKELIDRPSRDWMLDQVDFIVEIVGNEDLELGDETRSKLLQLLLAIANLNEQIRSQASLDF